MPWCHSRLCIELVFLLPNCTNRSHVNLVHHNISSHIYQSARRAKFMDSQTLQQLQDDIKNELSESLKNANFTSLLEKYGISGEKVLKLECSIDLTQIQMKNTENSSNINSLIPGNHIVKLGCDWCACCGCC